MVDPYVYYDFYGPSTSEKAPVYWCRSSLSTYNRKLLSPGVLLKRWCEIYDYENVPSNKSSGKF